MNKTKTAGTIFVVLLLAGIWIGPNIVGRDNTPYSRPTVDEVQANINGQASESETGLLAGIANNFTSGNLATSAAQSLGQNASLSVTGVTLNGRKTGPFSQDFVPEGISEANEEQYRFLMSLFIGYQVMPGDTFYKIEVAHSCTETQIRLVNWNLTGLIAGQGINIPVYCESDPWRTPTSHAEEASTGQGGEPTGNTWYIVRSGDTLFSILQGKKCLSQMDDIIAENNLDLKGRGSDLMVAIQIGQVLDLSACQ